MQKTKRKIIISGEKVHNVGYRPFLLAKAKRLRIPNYDACNIVEDGKQQIIVSLEGEEKSVQDFIDFAKKNHPPKAKVSDVREAEPPEYVMPIDEYVHLLGVEQQNTVVQAGLGMLDKQDQTIESINSGFAETKQDFTTLGEKIDNGFNKIDNDFTVLKSDYGKISQTMEKILKSMNDTSKKTEKILEVLTKQQQDFTQAINALTGAILKLAEKK